MRTPNIFIAYAPRGAGLRCALAYLASEGGGLAALGSQAVKTVAHSPVPVLVCR